MKKRYLVIGMMVGTLVCGSHVFAAEGKEVNNILPRAATRFSVSCTHSKASFSYINNTNDASYMEGKGTAYDILGKELETVYDYGVCKEHFGIGATYNGGGIYKFDVYATMYDGPNASYKVMDKQHETCYAE